MQDNKTIIKIDVLELGVGYINTEVNPTLVGDMCSMYDTTDTVLKRFPGTQLILKSNYPITIDGSRNHLITNAIGNNNGVRFEVDGKYLSRSIPWSFFVERHVNSIFLKVKVVDHGSLHAYVHMNSTFAQELLNLYRTFLSFVENSSVMLSATFDIQHLGKKINLYDDVQKVDPLQKGEFVRSRPDVHINASHAIHAIGVTRTLFWFTFLGAVETFSSRWSDLEELR